MSIEARLQFLLSSGNWNELELEARRLLGRNPVNAVAWQALGAACVRLQRYEEAGEALKRALALNPQDVESMRELGRLCALSGNPETAHACLRQALAVCPNYAPTWFTLGTVLKDSGDLPAALDCFRKAIALHPDFAEAHAALLFTRYNLDPAHIRPDAEAFARRLGAEPFAHWNCPPLKTEQPSASEPLRVALLSADFRNHAVARFLLTTLPALAAQGLELHAFSNWPAQDDDEITARLRHHFAHWHPVFGLPDAEVARRIHSSGIHVCLDLSGHTHGNRLGVFALRPAPVQAVWCGYATTGLAAMDAFIADADTLPPAAEAHFSEPVRRLPVRVCFSPPAFPHSLEFDVTAPATPLPALKNGYITFGCFQHLDKIRPNTLSLWAELLRRTPTARLRIQSHGLHLAPVRAALCETMRRCGLPPERVDLHGSMSCKDYMHAYDEVDIALDTFPYTGCTTTCEALWMGVPTLTFVGDTLISRQGYGVLRAAAVPDWADWCAGSPEDMLHKAEKAVRDLPRLAALRAGLRARMATSPLMDAPAYAAALASLLRTLWLEKTAPSSVTLPPAKETELVITSCVERVKQIMDCVIAAKTGPVVENADQCEAVLSWLADDDSRRLYSREITFKMLEPLVGTAGAIRYVSVLPLETWHHAEEEARRLLAAGRLPHVETDFPPDHPMSLFIPTCNFVLEQYAYPPHVTVSPTDSVLDGGACYGETALWFAGQGARVFAFEPNPSSLALLRKNVEHAGLGTRITPVESALGRVNGRLAFQHQADNPTGSAIARQPGAETFAVPVCTVDDWCKQQGVVPTWIKLDVEGAELDALHGAAGIITAHAPTITVALYHELSHMWEIPTLLRRLRPDYQFWCRKNHPQSEFVLYAQRRTA